MVQHETLACVDDVNHRSRLAAAHESIYKNNYAVNSMAVENPLQEDYLVPTAVCIYPLICGHLS